MTAGEAEFHAEGVGLRASAGEAVAERVDHLDPFTRRWIGRR